MEAHLVRLSGMAGDVLGIGQARERWPVILPEACPVCEARVIRKGLCRPGLVCQGCEYDRKFTGKERGEG